jgi:hypothetical protein
MNKKARHPGRGEAETRDPARGRSSERCLTSFLTRDVWLLTGSGIPCNCDQASKAETPIALETRRLSEELRGRGISWWLSAILAPIGLLGSPIAIAVTLQDLIVWNGPIGFVVHFWSENVRPPFSFLFGELADYLSLPHPPKVFIDYIVMSLMITTGYLRARILIPKHGTLHILGQSLLYLLLWPVAVIGVLVSVARHGVRSWSALILTLGPFFIFICLWMANLLLT